jgi:hypothetical protein
MRSLYISSVLRITAVFISRHLGQVIPTSVISTGLNSVYIDQTALSIC